MTPRRALDGDVDCLFHITAKGVHILNVVDAWIDPATFENLLRVPRWDMVLWPFQTMRELEVLCPAHALPPEGVPPELMDQLKRLRPRILVPSSCQFQMESWSWYNRAFFPISYRNFRECVEKEVPGVEVVRMDPGSSFHVSSGALRPAPRLEWVTCSMSSLADYEFDADLVPPPTADIARRFESLKDSEAARVLRYCQFEIIERLNAMEPAEDFTFLGSSVWQLSLYDHQGQELRFYYRVSKEKIELETVLDLKPSWITEVPVQRLYGALEYGESLTSMYVRILTDEPEPDLMTDPLLRSLFSGSAFEYQKAQLRKIKALVNC